MQSPNYSRKGRVAVASTVIREVALEIAVGAAVVRCEVGAEVSYVAELVRALRED